MSKAILRENITKNLKEHYNRDTRKRLVKKLKEEEKEEKPNYLIINQIFSYVLKELHWNMAENAQTWDNTPLDIMNEVFPQISQTVWYTEQKITTKKEINVQRDDEK